MSVSVSVGLDVELSANLAPDFPTAGTGLSVVSAQSVFTYLEQQRQNPNQELG